MGASGRGEAGWGAGGGGGAGEGRGVEQINVITDYPRPTNPKKTTTPKTVPLKNGRRR